MISKGLRWLRGGRSVSQRFPEGLAPWRVVGASITGSSHQRFGEPCQDAAGWALGPERSLIVAVADGAGSAKLGGEGARLAISTAIDHLTGRRSLGSGESHEKDLIAALERARSALASEAEDRGVDIRELATTLILLQATHDSVTALQVGDGSAVIEDNQNGITGLTKPQVGEYVNETIFITAEDAMDRVETTTHLGAPSGGAVFSDGLQLLALKMPEATPHPPFFEPLLRFVSTATDAQTTGEELRSFLASPRVTSQTADDLTLVLFSRDDNLAANQDRSG